MKKIVSNLSKRFLNEVHKNDKEETLDCLIDVLESIHDPDPSELYLLESLYQLKEKIKIAESRISSYLINENKSLMGNKLEDLYDSASYGSSRFFED